MRSSQVSSFLDRPVADKVPMKTQHKENCWKTMQCGQEPGGSRVDELGLCPAALPTGDEFDGRNRGLFAGRVCWAVKGTTCGSFGTGGSMSIVERYLACTQCKVMKQVQDEEGPGFDFGLK